MRVCFAIVVLMSCLCAAASAQFLSGDLNKDCKVDFNDLTLLSLSWLASDPNVELSKDSRANLLDLAVLATDWQQQQCPIVINEVLAHSHDTAPDWIELHNISSVSVDVGGWSLSESRKNLSQYVIAEGTVIPPDGYLVFYESRHFGNLLDPGTRDPFRLSENGDTLYLYSGADPNYPQCLVEQSFGASETWITFGRHLKSDGTYVFPLLSSATPGSANADPLIGPVVINEIMYHPSADGDAEYIELLNISADPVTLFDSASLLPWRLTTDTGLNATLPTDVPITLAPREHLLLAKKLSVVRQCYTVPVDVQALQWASGKLTNSGETIHLWKPGDADEVGTRYWIEADRVTFSDGSHGGVFAGGVDPWPTGPDGDGQSLNRRAPTQYGDDPNSWEAALPTPGSTND
jgi:hypothetical protein